MLPIHTYAHLIYFHTFIFNLLPFVYIRVTSRRKLPSKLRVALERGWEKKLPALLTDFKTSKEAEIERLCQRHYNGYLDSVQQLVYMRDDWCAHFPTPT